MRSAAQAAISANAVRAELPVHPEDHVDDPQPALARDAANKLLQALDTDTEVIGPIQMGLNKPIYFTDFESSVRDIVNITAVAVIDAYVDKLKNKGKGAQ